MKTPSRIAAVIAGYIVAFLVASAAVAIRFANTNTAVAQASSGMYAFGDAVVFVAVFGVCALVPTGAALFFLRPYRRFWVALSTLGVAVAVTGLSAAILFEVGRQARSTSLSTWASLSVLRILVAPLFALIFLVCSVCSPDRSVRIAFLTATFVEVAVGAYGAFVWFVPLFFQ